MFLINQDGGSMQVYDTANRLASEIKESEEYINFKMAKQAINLNYELEPAEDFEQHDGTCECSVPVDYCHGFAFITLFL